MPVTLGRSSNWAMESNVFWSTLPIEIRQLCEEIDFAKGPLDQTNKKNFWITDVHIRWDEEVSFLEGTYQESPLPNADEITDPHKWWNPTKPSNQILRVSLWEPIDWVQDVQTVILKAFEIHRYDEKMNLWNLRPQGAHAMIIPIFTGDDIKDTMVELFAGGFGGWQFANAFMMQIEQKRLTTLAVEKVMANCMQYAVQHDAVIFDSLSCMEDYDMMILGKDHIYNGDVRDLHWQKHVANLRPLLWTVSAPCLPWSSAGKEEGFKTEQGRLMAHVCCLIRLHRPKYVLLEQVANFAQHPDYRAFVKLVFFAGYRFVNTNQVEFALQDLAPVRRNRFLAWLVREEDAEPMKGPWVSWKHAPITSMFEYGAFIPSTEMDREKYMLSFELKLKYMNPDFLPPLVRQQRKHPLLYRVPGHFQVQGTFMSMYGHQHCISDEVLAKKGLFGQFCSEAGTYRFFKPQEIALLHTIASPVMFMNVSAGWRTQGDSISVPHALIAMSNVFAQEKMITMEPDQMVDCLIQKRYRATEVEIREKQEQDAIFLAETRDQIKAMQARFDLLRLDEETKLESFVLQPHRVWHPNMGQVEARYYLGPLEQQIPFPKWIEEEQLSPTQSFVLEEKAPQFQDLFYATGDNWCKAFVDAECTIEMLHRAWFYALGPCIQEQLIPHPVSGQPLQVAPTLPFDAPIRQDVMLTPRYVMPSDMQNMRNDAENGVVFLLLGDEIFLLRVEPSTSLETIRNSMQGLRVELGSWEKTFDGFGELQQGATFHFGQVLSNHPMPSLCGHEWKLLAKEIGGIHIESRVPAGTDHLVLQVHGDKAQLAAWHKMLFRILSPEWLSKHGRIMNVQLPEPTQVVVVFAPAGNRVPLPVSVLVQHLTIRITQAVLIAFESTQTEAAQVRFKLNGRNIHVGQYDADLSVRSLVDALTTALALEYHGHEPRLVTKGACFRAAEQLQELLNNKRTPEGNRMETMIAMQPPLFGGGAGSKKAHTQAIFAGLANLALQYGVKVHDVPHVTQQLFHEYGQSRLHHLLFAENEEDKKKHFRQLCEDSKIPLPSHESIESKVDLKYNRHKKTKQYHEMKNISVEDYEIQEGYFLLPDGQPAPILKRAAIDVTGVCMIAQEQAKPWMIQNQVASCDPLALFVVGQGDVPSHCRSEKVLVPATDQLSRGVLLAGSLVQIGTGDITTLPDPSPEVPTKPTSIAAFTFWRDEHQEESWTLIRDAPVKQAKIMLRQEGLQESLRSPWARSFRHNKQVVPPGEASSIQFHAEIDENCVARLVRASGLVGLYVTPKTPHGTPDSRWKPLWLLPEEAAGRSRFQSARGFAGFIRTEKNVAVRLEIEHFPQDGNS